MGNLFINVLFEQPFVYIATVVIVMFSICVHEFAHAWTALKQGDDTSAWLGHLSLNPMVQMGWPSMIMLLLTGIAWGAVPYNPRNFRNPWSGALMAFAGPLANLLLCVVFAGAWAFAARMALDEPTGAMQFFGRAALSNAMLFIFNMLPLPILDGWKVLSLFIPDMARVPAQHGSNISMLGILFLWTSSASEYLWSASAAIAGFFLRLWSMVAGL